MQGKITQGLDQRAEYCLQSEEEKRRERNEWHDDMREKEWQMTTERTNTNGMMT
ncbi:hypothetical protein FACS189472_16570 [Alphaproteobacteria bacterium]|nr:hypothetical protein FACS189472_16570 [Alphaproteobacteria bacterium]